MGTSSISDCYNLATLIRSTASFDIPTPRTKHRSSCSTATPRSTVQAQESNADGVQGTIHMLHLHNIFIFFVILSTAPEESLQCWFFSLLLGGPVQMSYKNAPQDERYFRPGGGLCRGGRLPRPAREGGGRLCGSGRIFSCSVCFTS